MTQTRPGNGAWNIDTRTRPSTLVMTCTGLLSASDMDALVIEHNRAVDSFGRAPYVVFCDLRGLLPLAPDAASRMEALKRYSSLHANFLGSAVLVDSAVTGLQHRRTSAMGGVLDTEIFTDRLDEALAYLSNKLDNR